GAQAMAEAASPARAVRGDERLGITRDPGDQGRLQTGQRYDLVGPDRTLRFELERPVFEGDRVRARAHADSALREERRDDGACRGPEKLERRFLVGDDDDLGRRATAL